jgi:hypothetical protein
MLPTFAKCVLKQAEIEARVAVARSCAALTTYKLAHGNYPGSLVQAMTVVRVDPFDLQPIRYRPDGGGFVVYSVGETGKYAGGSHEKPEVVLRVSAEGTMSTK